MFLKRIFDVLFCIICLLAFSPFFILIALITKITMPGPLFFLQKRIGKNGKTFYIYKFRTMKVDKEAEEKHDTSKDQFRVTSWGKFMRRTKIDELPQLLNVLKGEMSLVGPRPTFEEQAKYYNERQKRRLIMRPGMTGLAQVNGNIALTWEERIEYDIYYIEKFSVFLDVVILLKTMAVVLFGEEKFKRKKSE